MPDLIQKVIEKKKNQQNDPVYIQISEARVNFWEYCKYINPIFFKDSRPHLKEIADILQAFYEGRIVKQGKNWIIAAKNENKDLEVCKKLMLNEPPRHGKSYTLCLFVQWCYGQSKDNRIIDVAYNEILASRFSQNVRDGVDASKLEDKYHVFSDVFPEVKIKAGDASKQIWALEGEFFNYLGTGFGGTITGIGCKIGIIDDPVKNDKEAFNDNALSNQFSWYTDTFLSRIEEGGLQIIVMTRWSSKDLCGRLLEIEGDEWYVLCQKACVSEEKKQMLCSDLLSYKSYIKKKRLTSLNIFLANFQQEPIDIQGRLYSEFKTYDSAVGTEFDKIISYTDTADTGADFLAHYVGGISGTDLYILDIIYTDKPMEITEPLVAGSLYRNKVNFAVIESNNGGRGFARNVERILTDKYGRNVKTVIKWLHQSKNKKARILSNATLIVDRIFFPAGWEIKYPEAYKALSKYQAKGKNEHDDAADAITGIVEILAGDIKISGGGKYVSVVM